MIISIAKQFTKTPGGRYIKEGPYSGEEFRTTLLAPAFNKASKNGEELIVDLDGGFGYSPSFLEEAFGGLVRETKSEKVSKIKIVSEEEPSQITKIAGYISAALRTIK